MMNIEIEILLNDSLAVFSEFRDEINNAISYSKLSDPRYSRFALGQMHYYSERCQSLNLLLQEMRLWDSDIIMRAATECATRFIFVSIAPPVERKQRIEEYEISLNEINDLQRSERVKPAVAASIDAGAKMLLGGVALSAELEAQLRSRWPKTKRTQMKQKWSFSEMVKDLSKFYNEKIDLRLYKNLLHGYGLSSHLIHADQTAIDMFWDRIEREPSIRKLQEEAHFARLATTQVTLMFLCLRAISFATGFESRNKNLVKNLFKLTERGDKFHLAFADSQANMYSETKSL